jgi:hypothetical protein
MIEIKVMNDTFGRETFKGDNGQYFINENRCLVVEIYDDNGDVMHSGMYANWEAVTLRELDDSEAQVLTLAGMD